MQKLEPMTNHLTRTLALFFFVFFLIQWDGKKFNLRVLDRLTIMLQSYRASHTLRTYISYIFKKITLFFIYSVTDHTELHTICRYVRYIRYVYILATSQQCRKAWFSTIFLETSPWTGTRNRTENNYFFYCYLLCGC